MSNKKSGTKNQPQLPPFHPIAELFPLLQGEEFQELVGDIHRRGLKLPIWMYQNQVLDGRNRVRACAKAGYVLRAEDIRQFEGTDEEAVRFVMSMNIHRRQLPHGGLYAMPSLCGSAEATRGWFRAFADHSFLACRSL